MAGLARIAANRPPSSLTETSGQLSYPLNSENASPPGTLRSYLFWAERVLPARMVISVVAATIFPLPFLVIARFSLTRLRPAMWQAGRSIRRGILTAAWRLVHWTMVWHGPACLIGRSGATTAVTISRPSVKNMYRHLLVPLL